VYRRLFYALPEMEPMFARDAGGHIKGSMLAFAIDAILDFAGPSQWDLSHDRLRGAVA
jgi:hypothetical protein